ncbi:hypothetical protein MSAN_02497700 [Mycena sanguinolenta]|uniref:Uncharacterized protein n=1 Tax=Mycena sanguinolenta TaxID=230812 RepID=A0A8H6WRF7_9AGAR|nr:hypothetical protein MSAN_02497700 [Mycena sanguinolenta]
MNEQASDFAPNRNPNGVRSRSVPPTRPCRTLSGRNTTNGSRTHNGTSAAADRLHNTDADAGSTRGRASRCPTPRYGHITPPSASSQRTVSSRPARNPNPNPNPTTARPARPPTRPCTPRQDSHRPSSIASIAPIAADD